MHQRVASLATASIIALGLTTSSATARADIEDWTVFEYRLPVMRQPRPQLGRVDWRLMSELRMAGRFNGIEQIYFRTGPLFWLTNWLFVGTHVSVWAIGQTNATLSAGNYQLQTEVRWDLEPNFFGRLGPITLNSRNRIEYRYFNTAAPQWRFRSQLRINLAPKDWVVMPFVMEEPLFDLSVQGFYQNRAHIGVGFQVLPNVRIDVAYMNRARYVASSNSWDVDHAAWVNVFVDVLNPPPPVHLGAEPVATTALNNASTTTTRTAPTAGPTLIPAAVSPESAAPPASPESSLDAPPSAPPSLTAPSQPR